MQSFFWILSIIHALSTGSPMVTEFQWRYLSYAWDSMEQGSKYIISGKYDYAKMIPIDIDRSIDGRLFITIARDVGVPASVNVITNYTNEAGRLLIPYPDWSAHDTSNPCDGIVSVQRIAIDECNRLWMLDSGVIGDTRICPAKLSAYDLYSNTLVFTTIIRDIYARNKNKLGLLVNLVVETFGFQCDEVAVYIADTLGAAIIVYTWNAGRRKIYRQESDFYVPDVNSIKFDIAGESFHLPFGIYGLALSPMHYPDGGKLLTFKPLASRTISSIYTRVLKNRTNDITYFHDYNVLPSQASAIVYSSDGVLFYALTHETALGCWNGFQRIVRKPFTTILTDTERLQFVSGMKIIKDPYEFPSKEYLLVLTNRIQKIFKRTMVFSEINFRVLKVSVHDLIKGSPCDVN